MLKEFLREREREREGGDRQSVNIFTQKDAERERVTVFSGIERERKRKISG